MDHVGVVRTLIKYGARPKSKDVTRKTSTFYDVCVWFEWLIVVIFLFLNILTRMNAYCSVSLRCGSYDNERNIRVIKIVIEAIRAWSLFGQQVVLNGLPRIETME